jgi:short-subunit dehydrogenase
MPSINGKTIIVTGASAGVGEATAKLCVRQGANVVLAARDSKALDALAAALGPRSRAVVTDVSKAADCQALMKASLDAFGRIDGLVNNAGYNSRGAVETVALENLEHILEVNLKAPIRLCKLVLPHLRASGGGAIVNVASLAGRVPLDHEATYSATKFGLRGFSFAMAEELAGSGITVSVVSPGPIETGFILKEIADVPDMVFSQPMATADEVARAIVASLEDGKRERVMNFASGLLAHVAYLAPSFRAALKPSLEAKGRKAKERYLAAKRK